MRSPPALRAGRSPRAPASARPRTHRGTASSIGAGASSAGVAAASLGSSNDSAGGSVLVRVRIGASRHRPASGCTGLVMVLTRRGGPSVGAAGFGGSGLRAGHRLLAARGHRPLSEHVAARQRYPALAREALDELPPHDLFYRARGALHLDAVIALEQRHHFLAGRPQQLRDFVNPDSCQTVTSTSLQSLLCRLPRVPARRRRRPRREVPQSCRPRSLPQLPQPARQRRALRRPSARRRHRPRRSRARPPLQGERPNRSPPRGLLRRLHLPSRRPARGRQTAAPPRGASLPRS